MNIFEAAKKVTSEYIRGQWSLVIMDREDKERLIVCKNGSPLLVGLHEDCIMVASEMIALKNKTKQYISLKEGEVLDL